MKFPRSSLIGWDAITQGVSIKSEAWKAVLIENENALVFPYFAGTPASS